MWSCSVLNATVLSSSSEYQKVVKVVIQTPIGSGSAGKLVEDPTTKLLGLHYHFQHIMTLSTKILCIVRYPTSVDVLRGGRVSRLNALGNLGNVFGPQRHSACISLQCPNNNDYFYHDGSSPIRL